MNAKSFIRSKTIWFNVLIIAALVAHLMGRIDLTKTFTDVQDGDVPLLLAVAVANLLLRWITIKPVGSGGKPFFLSRTLWVNGLIVAGIVAQVMGWGDFMHYASEVADRLNKLFGVDQSGGVDSMGLLMLVLNNIFLRLLTEDAIKILPF